MKQKLEDLVKDGELQEKLVAIILFTDSDSAIVKCLKDDDNRNALDNVSGNILPVLTACHFTVPVRLSSPTKTDDKLYYMKDIDVTPNSNLSVLDLFDIDSAKALPQLVLFLFDHEKQGYHFAKKKINSTNAETAFNELKQHLATSANTLESHLLDENPKERIILAIKALDGHFKAVGALEKINVIAKLIQAIRGTSGV